MSSYVMIRLDTTPPTLQIHAPSYVSVGSITDVVVEANENVVNQDIYILDSLGRKHAVVGLVEGNRITCTLNFNEYPYGIATMYASATDEVLNQSGIVSASFNVLSNDFYTAHAKELANSTELKIVPMGANSDEKNNTLSVEIRDNRITIDEDSNKLDMKVEVR